MRWGCVLPLAVLSCAAHAAPPAPPAAPAESPAVDTMQQAKPAAKPDDGAGTTIVGERDSDLGLYLTPWKEEHADDIDPPPSLLDQPPQPIDAHAFARQVHDAETVSAYRRELRLSNR